MLDDMFSFVLFNTLGIGLILAIAAIGLQLP